MLRWLLGVAAVLVLAGTAEIAVYTAIGVASPSTGAPNAYAWTYGVAVYVHRIVTGVSEVPSTYAWAYAVALAFHRATFIPTLAIVTVYALGSWLVGRAASSTSMCRAGMALVAGTAAGLLGWSMCRAPCETDEAFAAVWPLLCQRCTTIGIAGFVIVVALVLVCSCDIRPRRRRHGKRDRDYYDDEYDDMVAC
jgi:hypothetical protein